MVTQSDILRKQENFCKISLQKYCHEVVYSRKLLSRCSPYTALFLWTLRPLDIDLIFCCCLSIGLWKCNICCIKFQCFWIVYLEQKKIYYAFSINYVNQRISLYWEDTISSDQDIQIFVALKYCCSKVLLDIAL